MFLKIKRSHRFLVKDQVPHEREAEHPHQLIKQGCNFKERTLFLFFYLSSPQFKTSNNLITLFNC